MKERFYAPDTADIAFADKPDELETLINPSVLLKLNAGLESLGIADMVKGDFYEYMVNSAVIAEAAEDDIVEVDFLGFRVEPISTYDLKSAKALPYIDQVEIPDSRNKRTFIHFSPELINKKPGLDEEILDSTILNLREKEELMAKGLMGALTFITLVESGLMEKPDVLVGVTNSTMANMADRFGLWRAETWRKKHLAGEIDVDVEEFDEFLELANKPIDPYEELEDSDDPFGFYTSMIYTELERRTDDPLAKKFLHKFVDSLINAFTKEHGGEVVYGTYDSFKRNVLSFYQKKGSKLIGRIASWHERAA